jgi:hypothetical protein
MVSSCKDGTPIVKGESFVSCSCMKKDEETWSDELLGKDETNRWKTRHFSTSRCLRIIMGVQYAILNY